MKNDEQILTPLGESILVFNEGEIFYGISASNVKEIIPMPDIMSMPRQPQVTLGISQYKGGTIPIYSMHQLCESQNQQKETVCVVCQVFDQVLGLAVCGVNELLNRGELFPVQHAMIANGRLKIQMVIQRENPVFVLLLSDMGEVFEIEEH